jgi:hypothetical protein
MPHSDLAAEQNYVDTAYACLAAMRERTRRATDIEDSAAQAVDSAIAQAHLRHRLASLDADVSGLSFARSTTRTTIPGTSGAATSRTRGATPLSSTGGPRCPTPWRARSPTWWSPGRRWP